MSNPVPALQQLDVLQRQLRLAEGCCVVCRSRDLWASTCPVREQGQGQGQGQAAGAYAGAMAGTAAAAAAAGALAGTVEAGQKKQHLHACGHIAADLPALPGTTPYPRLSNASRAAPHAIAAGGRGIGQSSASCCHMQMVPRCSNRAANIQGMVPGARALECAIAAGGRGTGRRTGTPLPMQSASRCSIGQPTFKGWCQGPGHRSVPSGCAAGRAVLRVVACAGSPRVASTFTLLTCT